MPAEPSEAGRSRRGGLAAAALLFALLALLASWNSFAAPVGLLVGLAAALLALRALRRRRGRRAFAVAALVVGLGSVALASAVLLLAAGAVTGELPGAPIVAGRSRASVGEMLEAARRRSAGARELAREARHEEGASPASGAEGAAVGTERDRTRLAPPAAAGVDEAK